MRNVIYTCFFLLLGGVTGAYGQPPKTPDYTGAYHYEVKNTPYGDFFGTINLKKTGDTYVGNIVNKAGIEYQLNVLKVNGEKMIFSSNVENSNSIFSCHFKRDSIFATIEVQGDNFLYKLKGKKSK